MFMLAQITTTILQKIFGFVNRFVIVYTSGLYGADPLAEAMGRGECAQTRPGGKEALGTPGSVTNGIARKSRGQD
jgi:hypothetical protein